MALKSLTSKGSRGDSGLLEVYFEAGYLNGLVRRSNYLPTYMPWHFLCRAPKRKEGSQDALRKRAVTTRMTAKTTSQLLGPALHTSLHYLHKRLRSFLLLLLLLLALSHRRLEHSKRPRHRNIPNLGSLPGPFYSSSWHGYEALLLP